MTPTTNLSAPVEQVKTVTPAGKAVKERITSVKAARDLYSKTKLAWGPVARRRARLKGLVDGNPPYSQTRLDELGLGYMNNNNYLEARAILDQKASSYYEQFLEAASLVECVLKGEVEDPKEPHPEWGDIIANEFTKMVLDWNGFLVMQDKARRESDLNGIGLAVWRDEEDWRPNAYSSGCFLPDPMAEVDIDKLGFYFLRDSFAAGELMDAALENEARAKEEGWNPAAVKTLLKKIYLPEEAGAQNTQQVYSPFTWEDVQQRIRNNDPTLQTKEFEKVRLVHLLIKEVKSGKVSHYIFAEDDPGTGLVDDFLFRLPERFDAMPESLWMLPYNYGDGYLKSVRGLASMIESHCDMSNRFLNRIYDAGFTTASLLLQPQTAMDLSKLQLVRMGIITVIPPGLSLQQSTFQPQIKPLMELRDMSTAIMRNNTGVWKTFTEGNTENQVQKTAREVAYQESRENRLEKSNIAFDYEHLQRLYREMFRRVLNPKYLKASTKPGGQEAARLFVAACVARGVPEQLLVASAWNLYAARTIGMGSWGVKLDLSNQILGARGMFDERGQTAAIRDWVGVRAGWHNVDRYKPLLNRNTIPSNEESIATLENNDMVEGAQVPVGSDQNHFRHLMNAHVPVLAQVVQAAEAGQPMDPQKGMILLQSLIPHLGGHLQWLQQDPVRKPTVDQVNELVKRGVDLFKVMKAQAQKLAQMQAQQQQAMGDRLQQADQVINDRETELKARKQEADIELAAKKLESLNQQRMIKMSEQIQQNREKTGANLQLSAEKQAADLQNSARVVDAKIEMDRLVAEAKAQKAAQGGGE